MLPNDERSAAGPVMGLRARGGARLGTRFRGVWRMRAVAAMAAGALVVTGCGAASAGGDGSDVRRSTGGTPTNGTREDSMQPQQAESQESERAVSAGPTAGSAALGASTPLYLGRFVVGLPPGIRVAVDRAAVQDIDVAEVSWPPEAPATAAVGHFARGAQAAANVASGFAPGGPAARAWAARIAELEGTRDFQPKAGGPVVTAVRQLSPHLRVLYRHDGRFNSGLVAAEALRDVGAYGLWARTPYSPGAEDSAAKYVRLLADNYHPDAELSRLGFGGPGWRGPAFHLRLGAFLLPYDLQEEVGATLLVDPRYGVRDARIEMSSGRDPEWGTGLIADWRARFAGPMEGVRGQLVRAAPRTVAGLPGEEVVARLHTDRGTSLALEFAYPGVKGEGLRPQVTVRFNTASLDGPAAEARVLALWDQVLGSTRPMPQGGPLGAP